VLLAHVAGIRAQAALRYGDRVVTLPADARQAYRERATGTIAGTKAGRGLRL